MSKNNLIALRCGAIKALDPITALEQTKEETKRTRQRETLIFLLGLTVGIVLAVGLLAVAALMFR